MTAVAVWSAAFALAAACPPAVLIWAWLTRDGREHRPPLTWRWRHNVKPRLRARRHKEVTPSAAMEQRGSGPEPGLRVGARGGPRSLPRPTDRPAPTVTTDVPGYSDDSTLWRGLVAITKGGQ